MFRRNAPGKATQKQLHIHLDSFGVGNLRRSFRLLYFASLYPSSLLVEATDRWITGRYSLGNIYMKGKCRKISVPLERVSDMRTLTNSWRRWSRWRQEPTFEPELGSLTWFERIPRDCVIFDAGSYQVEQIAVWYGCSERKNLFKFQVGWRRVK